MKKIILVAIILLNLNTKTIANEILGFPIIIDGDTIKILNNKIYSNGVRVLNITSTGNTYVSIRKNILKIIKTINWKKGFFRRDIGWRVI